MLFFQVFPLLSVFIKFHLHSLIFVVRVECSRAKRDEAEGLPAEREELVPQILVH